MRISRILKNSISVLKQANIPMPDLDARVLLEFVLQKDTAFLYTHPEFRLSFREYLKYRKLIQKRKKGLPVAYLTGTKEFFGHNFVVNKNVLVPRPESEEIVSTALQYLRKSILNSKVQNTKYKILDLGTGSGCLIISLALELAKYKIPDTKYDLFATDISKPALKVAENNARLHQVSNINFLRSDLFSNPKLPLEFDLILANLPYVPKSNNSNPEATTVKHEPQSAIYADDNGTSIIYKFLKESKTCLSKSSLIIVELDPRNAQELQKIAREIFPEANIELKKDLANLDRYLAITHN